MSSSCNYPQKRELNRNIPTGVPVLNEAFVVVNCYSKQYKPLECSQVLGNSMQRALNLESLFGICQPSCSCENWKIISQQWQQPLLPNVATASPGLGDFGWCPPLSHCSCTPAGQQFSPCIFLGMLESGREWLMLEGTVKVIQEHVVVWLENFS